MAGGINNIGNLRGKVDSNNALVVSLSEGSVLPSDADVAAGTGTAEAGLGGVLTVSTTSAQTGANTDATDLWTYSLPANTLSGNGYGVEITAWGTLAANGNNKTVSAVFGATTVNTLASTTNGGAWRMTATVIRSGASAQKAIGEQFRGSSSGGWSAESLNPSSPAADTTGAITIKVTGQNGTASAGDIVFTAAVVKFFRAGA